MYCNKIAYSIGDIRVGIKQGMFEKVQFENKVSIPIQCSHT